MQRRTLAPRRTDTENVFRPILPGTTLAPGVDAAAVLANAVKELSDANAAKYQIVDPTPIKRIRLDRSVEFPSAPGIASVSSASKPT